jgi:HSP20 family protein
MHAMRNEMIRVMNKLVRGGTPDGTSRRNGSWTPAVDVYEGNESFTLKAELPGFSKDDVQVEIKDNLLTLKGEHKRETAVKDAHYHRVERAYGSFVRSFTIPDDADGSKVTADFKDGVLKVHLAKDERAKPKAIEVKVA